MDAPLSLSFSSTSTQQHQHNNTNTNNVGTPHLVLLSKPYYHETIKPLLAEWSMLWLRTKHLTGLESEYIKEYLLKGSKSSQKCTESVRTNLSDVHIKLLNITHDWLRSFLPHVISKINRVKFGLLKKEDVERSSVRAGHQIPKSRRMLAVPFVGKDVPSDASEFSHPDIVIGLTALAYRYEGLRRSDMRVVLKQLKHDLQDESGPYHKRPTCRKYVDWVRDAGGEVRGMKALVGDNNEAKEEEEEEEEEKKEEDKKVVEVWQLQLLDMADEEQEEMVYKLLYKQPKLIEYYLHNFIFPETMENQPLRLSATGQELGGNLLFGRRLGFSGTPSNLLPLELGDCVYERGSDGKMVEYLTSRDIVSTRFVDENWSVDSLLRNVATGNKYDALIDTGALITGYTNREVAENLLRFGLPHKDGVVFLDRDDRKMIVLRKGLKVLPLDRCGISLGKRFAYYDNVHTTGMVLILVDSLSLSLSHAFTHIHTHTGYQARS